MRLVKELGILSGILLTAGGAAFVQNGKAWQGISRHDLQRRDLSAPGREAVQVRIDFAPGAAAGRHRHPGEEIIYVLQGTLEYHVDGQAPVTVDAGRVVFVPAGVIHSAINRGTGNASELATYIVQKGKPLVEQVQ